MLLRRRRGPPRKGDPGSRPSRDRLDQGFPFPTGSLAALHGVPRDNILAQEVADELVLLDLVGGGYYGLNEVGARVWHLLVAGESAAEVLATLLLEYEVDELSARQDLLALLAELNGRGLLEVHEVIPH